MKIYSEIASRMLKGMMFHRQMEDYFRFLGLEGLAKEQRERYLDENESYVDFCERAMRLTNRIVPTIKTEFATVIPENWYRYTRQDVDNGTKRAAVKTGITSWVEWEKETIATYEGYATLLREDGREKTAILVDELIASVCEELQKAETLSLDLAMVDYDLADILTITGKDG